MTMTPAAQLQTLEWWTCRELAMRWNCGIEAIRRMIEEGTLRAKEFGWEMRVHESEVRRMDRVRKGRAA